MSLHEHHDRLLPFDFLRRDHGLSYLRKEVINAHGVLEVATDEARAVLEVSALDAGLVGVVEVEHGPGGLAVAPARVKKGRNSMQVRKIFFDMVYRGAATPPRPAIPRLPGRGPRAP